MVTSFPQISLAVMLCKIVEPHTRSVVVEVDVCVISPLQLSVNSSIKAGSSAPHSIFISAGFAPTNTGAVSSIILTT